MKTWKTMAMVSIGAAVLASTAGCNRLRGGGASPSTEDEKTLYTLGMLLGRNLGNFNLTADELDMVKSGLTDMVLKRPHKVDMETYGPKVDALARKRQQEHVAVEKEHAKAYLESAGREAGAVVSPSGLVFKSTQEGTGEIPKPTDRVTVQYEGRLTDGTVFDSSKKRNAPATFPLNGVIKCWTEGVGKMKVGGKAQLTCPSSIAYGDSGRPPTIPGGATLIFDVELLSIAPPNVFNPAAPGAPGANPHAMGPGGPQQLQMKMGGGNPNAPHLTMPPATKLQPKPGDKPSP